MEKEKKEIKISLWTFYVLLAAVVVLVGAVIVGGLNVVRQNAEFSGTIFEFGDERESIYNKKYAKIAQKLWYNIYLEPDSNHRTSLQHEEKLTLDNIDNQTKLEVAIHKIIIESRTIKWFLMDKFGIDAKEVEKNVLELFGENATIKHENIYELGFKYTNGKYITNVDNIEEYEENASVYAGPTKAILNDDEIIVYEEYAKTISDKSTGINTVYATGDNKLKILEYKEEEWSTESPYEKIVMPVYKHTFRENTNGEYYWVSSELVNKNELQILDEENNTNLSNGNAETILNNMFGIAQKIYREDYNFILEEEPSVIEEGWYFSEVVNYEEVMNKHFTDNGKTEYEKDLESDYNLHGLFVKKNGKTYMSEGGSVETPKWINVKFNNITVQNDTITADVYADVAIDTIVDNVGTYTVMTGVKNQFVLKKENKEWKIDHYVDVEKYAYMKQI